MTKTHLIALFFIGTFVSGGFAQDVTDGLLARYEFNGNADDASGNGQHAIVNATLATDRNGDANSCYFFNGISDYIDLPNSSLLKPQLPVSISFWVKFSSLKPGVLTTDFAQNIHTGVWVALNSNGNIAFSFGDAGSTNPSSRRTKIGDTVLETGVWYHILGVVKSAIDIDIFINGINDCGTYSGTGGDITYSSSPGSIGRKDSNPSLPPHYFHGYIDEFYYWNRVVDINEITDTEITPAPTNFISFGVPAQIGPTLIDTLNHTIDLVVKCSNTLDLAATFVLSNNAKAYIDDVQQISGSSVNNFNTEKIYTIINSFGCSQYQSIWRVTLLKQSTSNSETYLQTSFNFIEVQNQVGLALIDSAKNIITFEINCNSDISSLYLKYIIQDNTVVSEANKEFLSGATFDFSTPVEVVLSNNISCAQNKWTIILKHKSFNEQDLFYNESFFIPDIITPNQDSKNDYFKLGESLIGSSVIILNRQGIPVYKSSNYQNDFNGANLASGVYYYAIEYDCYSSLIKGPITILK